MFFFSISSSFVLILQCFFRFTTNPFCFSLKPSNIEEGIRSIVFKAECCMLYARRYFEMDLYYIHCAKKFWLPIKQPIQLSTFYYKLLTFLGYVCFPCVSLIQVITQNTTMDSFEEGRCCKVSLEYNVKFSRYLSWFVMFPGIHRKSYTFALQPSGFEENTNRI